MSELNVIDAVIAAQLAKGDTGGVPKKYVDDGLALKQDKTLSSPVTVGSETETTVEGAIGELAGLVPSTAAPSTNKLATAGDVNGEEITVIASTSPLITTAAHPRKIAIFGKSEVVDGNIKSAGEGYAVVRLADLSWQWWDQHPNILFADVSDKQLGQCDMMCSAYPYRQDIVFNFKYESLYPDKTIYCSYTSAVYIKNTDYSTKEDFVASLGDATVYYQLADPTQGNCIAVKTDNGSGIDGTMATFETGTPLRGIPDTDVRDVMQWNGSAGKVTKNCNVLNMGGLTWNKADNGRMYSYPITGIKRPADRNTLPNIVNPIYMPDTDNNVGSLTTDKTIAIGNDYRVYVYDTDYTDATAFKTAMSGVKLVYERETPTTEQFTASENNSFAGLQTYSPQTAIAINDNPEFELEAYAGTTNGKAVAELDKALNNKIDDKITVSTTLTLAANGWSNNTQTVTFAHDTTKRNVIDITPSEVPAWAAAGVYASAETSTGITFTCATVPETALTFKVTSMEVS